MTDLARAMLDKADLTGAKGSCRHDNCVVLRLPWPYPRNQR